MSYTRPSEGGYYIYGTGDGVQFTNAYINNDELDVFLYKLSLRKTEMPYRINNGKDIISSFQKTEGEINE